MSRLFPYQGSSCTQALAYPAAPGITRANLPPVEISSYSILLTKTEKMITQKARFSVQDQLYYNSSTFPFHFLISYDAEEAFQVIYPLAMALKHCGLTYFIDLEQINWGGNMYNRMSYGFALAQYVLPVITEHSVKRYWARAELQNVLHRQIYSAGTRLLPVIAGTARQKEFILGKMPLLKNFECIDWQEDPSDTAQWLL